MRTILHLTAPAQQLFGIFPRMRFSSLEDEVPRCVFHKGSNYSKAPFQSTQLRDFPAQPDSLFLSFSFFHSHCLLGFACTISSYTPLTAHQSSHHSQSYGGLENYLKFGCLTMAVLEYMIFLFFFFSVESEWLRAVFFCCKHRGALGATKYKLSLQLRSTLRAPIPIKRKAYGPFRKVRLTCRSNACASRTT